MKKLRDFLAQNIYFLYLISVLTIVFVWIAYVYSPAPAQTQYVDLAYAFLHGKLNFIPPLRVFDDYALYGGKYYNYFGPAPAVFLMPFVFFFGLNFPQIILSFFATCINFFAIYKISQNKIHHQKDALWLTTFFIFGTVYIFLAITNVTAFTVQVFGIAFINLALYFYFAKKPLWLVSLCIAIAGMSRFTLFLSSIFFIIEIFKVNPWNRKKILSFFTPLILAVLLLFSYNYARFKNPLETGYGHTVTGNAIYRMEESHGIFNIIHIPGNIYFLLFKGPDPVRLDTTTYILTFPYIRVDEWGLGLFYTSPIFLYLLFVKLKDKYVVSSMITVIVTLIPIVTYYNSGLWQYGYRYALDFYPFLFLLLLSIFKDKLPLRAKALILYSIFFTLFYMYSIWHIYPFL